MWCMLHSHPEGRAKRGPACCPSSMLFLAHLLLQSYEQLLRWPLVSLGMLRLRCRQLHKHATEAKGASSILAGKCTVLQHCAGPLAVFGSAVHSSLPPVHPQLLCLSPIELELLKQSWGWLA